MIDQLFNLIKEHPVYFVTIWTAVLTGIHHAFDAFVDSLPAPQPLSSPAYQFLYAFANKFAGNYRKTSQ